MAIHVFTIDGAGNTYIDRSGIAHRIKTNETFSLTFNDTGDGGNFIGGVGLDGTVTCEDGYSFRFGNESRFTNFVSVADGEDSVDVGEVEITEEGNINRRWKVKMLNLTDADAIGSDNVATIRFEAVDNPMQVMTWTNINTATG